MADMRWHGKIRLGRAEKKPVPFLDTLIFCSGKIINIYIAAHLDNSSLQEVLNPLNYQAPEEYGSILIGDDGYNLSECLAYISNSI